MSRVCSARWGGGHLANGIDGFTRECGAALVRTHPNLRAAQIGDPGQAPGLHQRMLVLAKPERAAARQGRDCGAPWGRSGQEARRTRRHPTISGAGRGPAHQRRTLSGGPWLSAEFEPEHHLLQVRSASDERVQRTSSGTTASNFCASASRTAEGPPDAADCAACERGGERLRIDRGLRRHGEERGA